MQQPGAGLICLLLSRPYPSCAKRSAAAAVKQQFGITRLLPLTFGPLNFESRVGDRKQGGGKPIEFAELNEDQATYLMTLFRNTEIVRAFKIKLVKAFRKAINSIRIGCTVTAMSHAVVHAELTAKLGWKSAISLDVDYPALNGSTMSADFISMQDRKSFGLVDDHID